MSATEPHAVKTAIWNEAWVVTRWQHFSWHDAHPPRPIDAKARAEGSLQAHAIGARCETCNEALRPATFEPATDLLAAARASLPQPPDHEHKWTAGARWVCSTCGEPRRYDEADQ